MRRVSARKPSVNRHPVPVNAESSVWFCTGQSPFAYPMRCAKDVGASAVMSQARSSSANDEHHEHWLHPIREGMKLSKLH